MGDTTQYQPIITVLAVLASAVSIAYTTYRYNSSPAKRDLVDLYEKQIDALREEKAEFDEKYHEIRSQLAAMNLELSKKIENLTGQLQEKDRQVNELSAILANRNPELIEILVELKNLMFSINQKTVTNQSRNEAIDKAKSQARRKSRSHA